MVKKIVASIATIVQVILGLHTWDDSRKEEVPSRDWRPIKFGRRGIFRNPHYKNK